MLHCLQREDLVKGSRRPHNRAGQHYATAIMYGIAVLPRCAHDFNEILLWTSTRWTSLQGATKCHDEQTSINILP